MGPQITTEEVLNVQKRKRHEMESITKSAVLLRHPEKFIVSQLNASAGSSGMGVLHDHLVESVALLTGDRNLATRYMNVVHLGYLTTQLFDGDPVNAVPMFLTVDRILTVTPVNGYPTRKIMLFPMLYVFYKIIWYDVRPI